MRAGVIVMMKNTLTHSPKGSQQNASPDASTVVQTDTLVKIVLDHRPDAENAIGPEETTRRLALNSGRSGQSKTKLPKRREKAKQLKRPGCFSCQERDS
jgi:hypothetical protein